MTQAVVDIILSKISSLPFIDTYTGLVKEVRRIRPQENGEGTETQIFPVGCDVTSTDCEQMRFSPLTPDDSKKSVLWFEDPEGAQLVRTDKNRKYYRARPWMILWLNKNKLGRTDCSIACDAILNVIKQGTFFTSENSGQYIGLKADIATVTTDSRFFTKYTWNEGITQYLFHPYDFVVCRWEITWQVRQDCITDFVVNPEIPC